MPTPDPRLARHASSRALVPVGEVVLKADRPSSIIRHAAPTSAQVEHERSLWGPHPDPLHAWVEEQLYGLGFGYMRGLLRFALGDRRAQVTKAEGGLGPGAPGWGDVMRLFSSPAPAEQKMATWGSLVDQFTHAFLPGQTVADQAAAWALRSSLLTAIGDRVKGIMGPSPWAAFHRTLPPSGQAILDWQKANGAQFITRLTEQARSRVLDTLVDAQLAGGDHHALSTQLLRTFGALNRDWRRIAITETAMAVASGQLSMVADSLEWEASWVAGPGACPFCHKMNGRTFRIVPADHPGKDGQTMVWPGKNNVGRSMHLHRRDGTLRGPDELWWPCIPGHPNCACVWAIRRIPTSATAKRAASQLAALRASRVH